MIENNVVNPITDINNVAATNINPKTINATTDLDIGAAHSNMIDNIVNQIIDYCVDQMRLPSAMC